MDIQALSDELVAYGVKNGMQDLYIQFHLQQWQAVFRKGPDFFFKESLTKKQAQQLIMRFKYLGEMDVGENRKAQLGGISYPLTSGKIQRLRLSVVGDYRGRESLVIRFLHPLSTESQSFFIPEQLEIVKKATKRRGLYLFSGPTGSGKTTLMYQLASKATGQVITIEDPVEIEEPAFLQLQTNPKIQQTYDELIQLSLRHRPDVLIIGEIRDSKTAQAAIRGALTGTKVFATLHGKSVSGATARLKELLVNAGELENCLAGIIYQRLLPDQQGQLAALLAYDFLNEEVAYGNWQENLQELFKKGKITKKTWENEL